MPLSYIKKSKIDNNKIHIGYKLFCIHNNNLYGILGKYEKNHMFHKTRWNIDTQHHITVAMDGEEYENGFHLFRDWEAAYFICLEWLGSNKNWKVYKVKYTNIVATGTEWDYNIDVVKKFKILRDITPKKASNSIYSTKPKGV